MSVKGKIFDIKKFAVHDGPGIRSTVFFKGCPLRCLWCHNPEGISPRTEIMVFASRCIRDCRDCLAACPRRALSKGKGGIVLERELCDGCGACASVCPAEALQQAGREVTPGEVVAELEKDRAFYQDSQGGVTFSGGEPLQQPEFLRALLLQCRRHGFHTAVDTSGHAPYAQFEKILPLCDLLLFDLKIMDNDKHKRLTGVANHLILDNLQKLSRASRSLAIRIPLVPGCNDSPRDLAQLADFCASLPKRHPVHLLPYHRGYVSKLKRLGLPAPLEDTRPPTAPAVQKIKDIFSKRKLTVKTGG
jgi:pyruvate formate lyase activating enzyme